MTQLPQEGAVGDANDEPVVAAEPTIEDRFAAFSEGDSDDEPEAEAPPQEGAEEPELTPDDVTDEAEAEEAPPIAPPVSWTAEEKEAFNSLPRELQETVTRREADREKFVQSKAQEAKSAQAEAQRQALIVVQNVQAQAAQQLQQYAAQLDVPEPDPSLIAEDPDLYAQQLRAHRHYAAQRQQAQQHAHIAAQQAAQAQREAEALEQEQTRAILAEQFPEYLDPTEGAKLRQELGSIALDLGYSAEQLATVDAKDILAMRHVANLKAKADKYDALMKQKMETVRSAKGLPKVSRPGVATGKGVVENQRYAEDRKAMKQGDRDASVRVFSRFV